MLKELVMCLCIASAAAHWDKPLSMYGLDLLGGSIAEFGIQLLRDLDADERNICVSPLAISTPLSALYTGARGQTKRDLAYSLNYGRASPKAVAELFRRQWGILNKRKKSGYVLTAASKLFVLKSFRLNQTFVDTARNNFDTDVLSINFRKDSSDIIDQINRFIANSTQNMIPNFLSGPPPKQTIIFVASTLFFQGTWKYPFSRKHSFEQKFHGVNSVSSRKFMTQANNFNYTRSYALKAQIVELPYSGDDVAMYIFLPNAGQNFTLWLESLTVKKIVDACKTMRQQLVNVTMPKFLQHYSFDLEFVLQIGAMNRAFDEFADFSGISSVDGLHISKVSSKSVIGVNEDGTLASAAAAGGHAGFNSLPAAPLNFMANRPFLYVLFFRPTMQAIFAGTVVTF